MLTFNYGTSSSSKDYGLEKTFLEFGERQNLFVGVLHAFRRQHTRNVAIVEQIQEAMLRVARAQRAVDIDGDYFTQKIY